MEPALFALSDARWLDWLAAHRTAEGALPEKVLAEKIDAPRIGLGRVRVLDPEGRERFREALTAPHVLVGANIAIEYGRPFLKGRPESQMMPPGREWRTGADEATIITTDKPLKFGTVSLAPGSYTLNTQPTEKGWELIFGKLGKPGQWGVPYQAPLEIGRAPMTLQSRLQEPADDSTPAGGA